MLILVLGMLLIAGGTYFAMEYAIVGKRQMRAQLRRAASYAIVSHREKELNKNARERLLGPLMARLTQIAMRVSPQGSRLEMGRKLQSAGVNARPQTILALKAGFTIGGVILGILGAVVAKQPVFLMTGLGVAAVGFIGPDFWLNSKIRGRRDAIDRMLPDTLDLLTVSVEAGLGFDSAVAKVTEKMQGPLVDELAVMAREIRIGETRRQALRNMGDRVGSEGVKSFTRSIIQAEELGTSLGRTLRVQAHDLRITRQLTAEEKAMKAPVKMLFPTVLFIFPAMFIVILGPAMLNIMEALSSTG